MRKQECATPTVSAAGPEAQSVRGGAEWGRGRGDGSALAGGRGRAGKRLLRGSRRGADARGPRHPGSWRSRPSAMPSYTVTVATGSQWFAGTDDYIYLSLVGSAGCSEKHLLDKPFYNDFERGAVRKRGWGHSGPVGAAVTEAGGGGGRPRPVGAVGPGLGECPGPRRDGWDPSSEWEALRSEVGRAPRFSPGSRRRCKVCSPLHK